jgi:hypothetical protein
MTPTKNFFDFLLIVTFIRRRLYKGMQMVWIHSNISNPFGDSTCSLCTGISSRYGGGVIVGVDIWLLFEKM